MKNPRPIAAAGNATLRGSWPALQRAAERARQIAAQTGTALVVIRDGTVQHLYPQAVAQAAPSVQEMLPADEKSV